MDEEKYQVKSCSLPDIRDCDGNWVEHFKIFKDLPEFDKLNEIPDATGQKRCCYDGNAAGAEIVEGKTCNWNNKDITDGTEHMFGPDVEGMTGFLCKYAADAVDAGQWKDFEINVTNNQLRSGLRSLDGLQDPATHLPWYDSGVQWPSKGVCSYGSAQDQMTMTYISFTGYLR